MLKVRPKEKQNGIPIAKRASQEGYWEKRERQKEIIKGVEEDRVSRAKKESLLITHWLQTWCVPIYNFHTLKLYSHCSFCSFFFGGALRDPAKVAISPL